jgi:phage regulator Rha-like protein
VEELMNTKTVTSLQIAETTGKSHDNVLKAIRNMEGARVKVTGVKGEKRPMFELTKDESWKN